MRANRLAHVYGERKEAILVAVRPGANQIAFGDSVPRWPLVVAKTKKGPALDAPCVVPDSRVHVLFRALLQQLDGRLVSPTLLPVLLEFSQTRIIRLQIPLHALVGFASLLDIGAIPSRPVARQRSTTEGEKEAVVLVLLIRVTEPLRAVRVPSRQEVARDNKIESFLDYLHGLVHASIDGRSLHGIWPRPRNGPPEIVLQREVVLLGIFEDRIRDQEPCVLRQIPKNLAKDFIRHAKGGKSAVFSREHIGKLLSRVLIKRLCMLIAFECVENGLPNLACLCVEPRLVDIFGLLGERRTGPWPELAFPLPA